MAGCLLNQILPPPGFPQFSGGSSFTGHVARVSGFVDQKADIFTASHR